jgi:hypothetical protein
MTHRPVTWGYFYEKVLHKIFKPPIIYTSLKEIEMRVDILTKDFNPDGKPLTKREDILKKEADNYIPSILFKQNVKGMPRAKKSTVVRRLTTKMGLGRRLSVKSMSRKNSTVGGFEYLIKIDKAAASVKRRASFSNPPSGRNMYQVNSNNGDRASSGEKRASFIDEPETINSLNQMNMNKQESSSKFYQVTFRV